LSGPAEVPATLAGPDPDEQRRAAEHWPAGEHPDLLLKPGCHACRHTGRLDERPCPFCARELPCDECGVVVLVGFGVDPAADVYCPDHSSAPPAPASCPESGEEDPASSLRVSDQGSSPGPDEQPDVCPLCGSARASLVFVPPSYLGENGQWRCSNATACRDRQAARGGIDAARLAIGRGDD
jgi:hypothetical protein